MDFWEGEFLGPIWAHTDFEDRTHPGFHFLIGFMALLSFLLIYFVPSLAKYLSLPSLVYLLIALFLLIFLPFLAAQYHRVHKPVRVLILLAYACQYCFAWCFVLKEMANVSSGNSAMGLFFELGEIANNFMGMMSDFFSFLGGISATLLGVISGSILMGLVGILIFIVALYIPLLYFFIIKSLQRVVDGLVHKLLYQDKTAR